MDIVEGTCLKSCPTTHTKSEGGQGGHYTAHFKPKDAKLYVNACVVKADVKKQDGMVLAH